MCACMCECPSHSGAQHHAVLCPNPRRFILFLLCGIFYDEMLANAIWAFQVGVLVVLTWHGMLTWHAPRADMPYFR